MSGETSEKLTPPLRLSELEAALPVNLCWKVGTEEHVPKFLQLLSRLTEKLEPSGRSKETQRRLNVQKEKTETTRKKFLETSLKVEILNEVVLRNELTNDSLLYGSHETALISNLRDGITLAEVTTLCLNPHDMRLQPKLGTDFGRQILPLIEDVLYEKCLSILQLLDPSTEQVTSQRTVFPLLVRLGERVGDVCAHYKKDKQEESRLNKELGEGYKKKLELINRAVSHLDSLVNEHFVNSQAKHKQILTNYLGIKTEGMALKLKCIEFEILNATYTKDTVAAIRKIRSRLTMRLSEATEELSSLRSTLAQYQAAGPDFGDIVLEYARLQKEIEGKRWAISELSGGLEEN